MIIVSVLVLEMFSIRVYEINFKVNPASMYGSSVIIQDRFYRSRYLSGVGGRLMLVFLIFRLLYLLGERIIYSCDHCEF